MYIEYMIKHEPQWPYSEHRLTHTNPLHNPPLACYPNTHSITISPCPLPSPFRHTNITNGVPYMISFPHRNEVLPFYPMQKEKDKWLMIRLHEQLDSPHSKSCIINMPCYIYYETTKKLYLLGYEAFLLT